MKIIDYDYSGFTICADEESNVLEVLNGLHTSKRFINQLFNMGSVKLNGSLTKKSSPVISGDIVEILFLDEEVEYEMWDEDLDIVYESSQLLIISKPPFEAIHPTKSHPRYTTLNKVANYYKRNGIARKIRFVNRIDMETSGLVIIAKNQFVDQQISKQNEEGTIIKKYLAVCSGIVKGEHGLIEKPVVDPEFASTVKTIGDSGREAVTEYWVKERYDDFTLVEIRIHTGRSHQIRLHFSSIGHPLIGDILYGSVSENINRHALHAYYLAFKNPFTNELIELEIPMAIDLEGLIYDGSNLE